MIEKINKLIKQAMLEKATTTRDILRLAKGEIERESNKAKDDKKDFTDKDVESVVRKLIKSNQTTLKLYLEDCAGKIVPGITKKTDLLTKEIFILRELLPKSMTAHDLHYFMINHNIDISQCKSEGQAVGMIIKEAKKAEMNVEVETVKEFVKEKWGKI